jgi:hypothetical protein
VQGPKKSFATPLKGETDEELRAYYYDGIRRSHSKASDPLEAVAVRTRLHFYFNAFLTTGPEVNKKWEIAQTFKNRLKQQHTHRLSAVMKKCGAGTALRGTATGNSQLEPAALVGSKRQASSNVEVRTYTTVARDPVVFEDNCGAAEGDNNNTATGASGLAAAMMKESGDDGDCCVDGEGEGLSFGDDEESLARNGGEDDSGHLHAASTTALAPYTGATLALVPSQALTFRVQSDSCGKHWTSFVGMVFYESTMGV